MTKLKVICENCGFKEELTSKEISAGSLVGGVKCSSCGEILPLPGGKDSPEGKGGKAGQDKKTKQKKKSKYGDIDAMTGLDDVLENQPGDENGQNSDQSALAMDDRQGTQRAVDNSLSHELPGGVPQANAAASAKEAPKVDIFEAQGTRKEPDRHSTTVQDGIKNAAREMAGGAAGVAREKIRETVQHGREDPLFVANIINSWFRRIAGRADQSFESWENSSIKLGHYTLIASAAIIFIAGILISLRSLSFGPFLNGLLLSATLFFGQFLALKGFDLIQGYVEKTPSRLPGKTLPEVLSALSVLLAVLFIASGVILTIGYASLVWLGVAMLGAIIGYFSSAVFMECERRLNVSLDESLPISEIIMELITVKLKALVAITPFIFGFGSVAMALCMIWPLFSMLLFSVNPINSANLHLQQKGLLLCAFMPILAYSYIIFWAFLLQIARTLLGLGKSE